MTRFSPPLGNVSIGAGGVHTMPVITQKRLLTVLTVLVLAVLLVLLALVVSFAPHYLAGGGDWSGLQHPLAGGMRGAYLV